MKFFIIAAIIVLVALLAGYFSGPRGGDRGAGMTGVFVVVLLAAAIIFAAVSHYDKSPEGKCVNSGHSWVHGVCK